MITLSPYETAQACSSSYDVFSRLFDAGVTAEMLPYMTGIAELHATLPERYDADAAAATHQRLFGFNVFAYESMFLSADTLMGGPVTGDVAQYCRQAGYNAALGEAADHIANELALLAFLCGAEADAWQDGQAGEAARMQAVQRDFLDRHPLRWLPGLSIAIQQQDEPFYSALAGLVTDLALEHRAALADDLLNPVAPFALPAAPDLLSNQRAGLREVAEFLLTTVHSGIYLSRDDIGRLGRPHNLPTGFGSRRIMLTNLLRSAAQFDAVSALLADLRTLVAHWRAGYAGLLESPATCVRTIGAVWTDRLTQTANLLDQLGEAATAWQQDDGLGDQNA